MGRVTTCSCVLTILINYTTNISNPHKNPYRPPHAKPSEVAEFYKIVIDQFPDINPLDVAAMSRAATRYAKQIVKGKVAELFGLSLDTAIQWLKDPEVPMNYKRDIIVKVLGHSLPQNITLNTMDAEDGEARPVVFQMARPAAEEITRKDEKEFYETINNKKVTHG